MKQEKSINTATPNLESLEHKVYSYYLNVNAVRAMIQMIIKVSQPMLI